MTLTASFSIVKLLERDVAFFRKKVSVVIFAMAYTNRHTSQAYFFQFSYSLAKNGHAMHESVQ